MLLADLGADVVCVDRLEPDASGVRLPREIDVMQRGKRSIALDLKRPAGLEVASRLIRGADALIEGFRPGVMERLGLGPDVCLASNPRLVYGRMTGWGQHGPLAERAGHDLAYIARSGVLHAIGRAGGPPQIPVNVVGDFGGGSLYLAMGLLAAVLEARQSGRGQVVDAAIVDGVASMLAPIYALLSAGWWSDRRGSNLLDSGAPFYDVYETLDGKHVAAAPIESKFYAEFVRLLGLRQDDLPGQWDIAQWPQLRTRIAEAFRTRSRDEWTAVFDGTDACVSPVLSLREAAADPHAQARGTFLGDGSRLQPAPVPRLSRTPAEIRGGPAPVGGHSAAVLAEAGYADEEVRQLVAAGIVRLAPPAPTPQG
jgi:alpha-methylacyl-CoA racemase